MGQRYALMAGWVLVAILGISAAIYLLLRVPYSGSDFAMYLAAGQALRFNPGADIYQVNTLRAALAAHGGCPIWGLQYPYPPLLAVLLEPLTFLSCAGAWYVWQAVNLALWLGCTVMLVRRARVAGPWYALAVGALSVTFLPLIQGLLIGQVHVIVLASVLGALALVRRNRPYAAGMVLGLGALIKYYPAFIVVYYLLRRQWRPAVGAAVAGVVLVLAQIVVLGPQSLFADLFGGVQAVGSRSHAMWVSVVPAGSLLAVLAGIAFAAGVLWIGSRQETSDDLGVAWALCTMLLLSPITRWLYLTWLLPAFAGCLVVALRAQGWRRWAWIALIGLAYALAITRMVLPKASDGTTGVLLSSALATFLLWGVCGAMYLRSAGISFSSLRLLLRRQSVEAPTPLHS